MDFFHPLGSDYDYCPNMYTMFFPLGVITIWKKKKMKLCVCKEPTFFFSIIIETYFFLLHAETQIFWRRLPFKIWWNFQSKSSLFLRQKSCWLQLESGEANGRIIQYRLQMHYYSIISWAGCFDLTRMFLGIESCMT